MKHLPLIAFWVFSALLPAKSFSAVIYVNVGASGANNGTSWADAYTGLQPAITASVPGDEIWVAAGTYLPTTGTDRGISFVLKNGVKFYGGFNGTETALGQRNPQTNITILSGNIGQAGLATDNTYHVVTGANLSNLTRLDGFKITEGYAYGTTAADRLGGGLKISNSSFIVANCSFQLGYAYFYGGAVSKDGSGTVVFDTCSFQYNNVDLYSGAAHVNSGNADFNDCLFMYNVSEDNGGAFYKEGSTGVVNFRRCRFENNSSGQFGGVAYLRAGAANFTACDFRLNTSNAGGGALFMGQGNTTMSDCIFSGNSSQTSGGALYANIDAKYEMYNSLFVGNAAALGSACMYNGGGPGQSNKIYSCTFAHNKGGTNSITSTISTSHNSSVRNCVFLQNQTTNDIIGNTVTVSYCITDGSFSSSNQSNILTGNALFVAPGSAAQAPFALTASHDYGLKITSPALNAGDNTYATMPGDLAGNTRIFGPKVDLGCYEKNYCALTTAIDASGPLSFCSGENVTLTATGGTGYTWSTGSTAANITVSQTGSYTVTAVNENSGCLGTAGVSVTVNPLPNPAISLNQATWTLSTSVFDSYQWLLNNQPIAGAVNQSYTPTQNGQYKVTVTNIYGCEKTSAAYNFVNTTGIDEAVASAAFAMYPNPASGRVVLAPGENFAGGRLQILDGLGRMVLDKNITGETVEIDVTTFAQGVYVVSITTAHGKRGTQRLVVNR